MPSQADLIIPLIDERSDENQEKQRLSKAKESYQRGNADQSKKAHQVWMDRRRSDDVRSRCGSHQEPGHGEASLTKAMVFGGLDGVGTAFALLAGSVGSSLELSQVLAMCSATIFASALSMAFGEYISGKAEQDFALSEKKRESWEVDIFPEGEIAEMIDLYKSKGISDEDAEIIASTISKYKDFWVEHMMLHELNIVPPRDDESLWDNFKGAIVMFFSFAIFGMIPIIAYCFVLRLSTIKPHEAFMFSAGVAVLTLFALGGIKSWMAETNWIIGGAIMGFQGTVAGASAYYIGNVLGSGT